MPAPRLLGLVLLATAALSATGCSKDAAAPEPTTTYKYDPLTAAAPAEPTAEAETDDKKARRKPSSTAPGAKTYVVQLGAFTKRENADKLFSELQAKNYPVILKTLDHKDFGHMYLVRLKPYSDRVEAERMATELAGTEKLKPSVFVPRYK